MSEAKPPKTVAPWRQKMWEVIFESETHAGKAFDIVLLVAILASVVVVLIESTPNLNPSMARNLFRLEVFFTLLFTIEYFFRIISVRRPLRYMLSFYGLVDLMAVLPTYISFFIPGAQYFLIVRILRLLRVFRILKLGAYLSEAEGLGRALYSSRIKIGVFLFAVMTIVVIVGAAVYVIEGPENGFTSIPLSVYWAVVTMTTVGYGDLVPQTPLGKGLATLVMLIGYGIIAVPTGIVTAELARNPDQAASAGINTLEIICPACSRAGHDSDAVFCKHCGSRIPRGVS